MNKVLWFLLLVMAFPAFAEDNGSTFIYTRTVLKLIPKPEPKAISSPLPDPAPLPVTKESTKGKLYTKADLKKEEELKIKKPEPPEEVPLSPPAPLPRTPVDFNVEVKTPDYLQQPDFITHNDMATHEGLLITVEPVGKTTVTPTHMVGKSDVLFINEDGYITKIAPNLDLAELSEPIPSGQPVIGVLYIKAGSVEEDRIVPGDRFENPMFKTHPIVIQ